MQLPKILLVDDESENLRALERTLRNHFEVHSTTDPREALARVSHEDFCVAVCDQKMPQMRGTELLMQMGKIRPLITRVILTAHSEAKEMLEAINRAEIYRYILKPWDNEELISALSSAVRHHELASQNANLVKELANKNRELQALNQSLEKVVETRTAELKEAMLRLSELALTDPLTRVANRRAFSQKFTEELERSRRYRYPISLAMIDVDHFKEFNDMEGHVYGDEALRKVTQIFSSNLRKTDFLARYGGEEFILMMPMTQPEHAKEICERLRAGIETMSFQGGKAPAYLTVSIGLAVFPGHGENSEEMVKAADQALYQAKELGRNRVIVFSRNIASDDTSSFFIT